MIEHRNTIWDAFQTHLTSKDVIYTIISELIPNGTTDPNTKLHSLEQQIKELTALFKEQQVNQVHQSSSRPAEANNRSGQNTTGICSYTLRYSEIRQEMDTPSCTAELKLSMMRLKDIRIGTNKSVEQSSLIIVIKEEDELLGSQNIQKCSQQPRYGKQNDQTPYRQIGSNPDKNRNSNLDGQHHSDSSSNFWNNGPNKRQQTQYNFTA